MTLIDTHTHLYLNEFKGDIDDVIRRANLEGVSSFYLPAIDSSEMDNLLHLEARYPDSCKAMTGLHPCSVKENYKDELSQIAFHLGKRKFVAIGEIGLDFYWDKTFVQEQYTAFHNQIEIALAHNIPIVIHSRDALDEAIAVVQEYHSRGLRGIFHCFGGTLEQAESIIKTGFYLGIGGIITYKNSGVAAVIANLDMNHLVLETDAPYLTPVPFRGKRNESSYLKYIAAKIAEVKDLSLEEVASVTTLNANKVFGFSQR